MINEAQVARDSVSAALADRLMATLDDTPFQPTAAQLAWVDGGDLVAGHEDGPLARIAAGRYASLFANNVIGDISADGAAGAYIRIFECARQAFLQSLSRGLPPDSDALRWENEGGATRPARPGSRD